MSDLIERLHNADPHEHGDNFQLVCEAADEIERLQSLLEAANEMEADREAALQEIDRLQKRNALLEDVAVAAEQHFACGPENMRANLKLACALDKLREVCDE